MNVGGSIKLVSLRNKALQVVSPARCMKTMILMFWVEFLVVLFEWFCTWEYIHDLLGRGDEISNGISIIGLRCKYLVMNLQELLICYLRP